ncbi:Ubiquitin-conjugating enzyme/RWD-like protein [Metarhizium album ARSEF 1941]|uniref:Ubiquitin-conjugating enzyme/RWD-like protein n=1 Tax=Metarhizium album (strain ARSEF 1941) TaxID=1081103 RepID=A0A0B2WGP8_METAS|nr:Ubiquitin-conjugating enzyme/RWD-like protein [Metarhizium album ARSEF 1941]KHN95176.1 Ubiquitin-conjugating enzyme/RWD-like protein [Metarhizium album ARSEF 1941]
MPVQQHVLNWLYSVLTSEYHDVNRTYNDVAQALTQYPTLSPRTDVHTFSNGSSALLLHITGTIPVDFRGNTYRFPISIWVPHAYPREPPVVYVTPTETMMVRPGQHVDPQGQVYHPYLVGWAQFWDKSNIRDFMSVLSDVFAKEPPVVSRHAARQQPQPIQAPPPVPPLPPEMAPRPVQTAQGSTIPPPPPPKEDQTPQPSRNPAFPSSAQSVRTSSVPSRYESAPPLPTQAPASPPTARHAQPPPQLRHLSQQYAQPPTDCWPPSHGTPQTGPCSPQQLPPQWQAQGPPPPGYAAAPGTGMPPHIQQPPVQQTAPPPPNILDEPLTLDIPEATTVAPPPIPPNPEKDNLLRQIAQTLYVIRQQSRQQNESTMAGLHGQRNAMQNAMAGIQSESSQLSQLSNVLTSNTAILHDALRKADAVIDGSRSHPAPDIDELLVAPTVVSNQLYNLVAEERALGDAIFTLGRAVERGRISPAVFARTTRSLAREWYLKKALVRKIGQGMGMTLAQP